MVCRWGRHYNYIFALIRGICVWKDRHCECGFCSVIRQEASLIVTLKHLYVPRTGKLAANKEDSYSDTETDITRYGEVFHIESSIGFLCFSAGKQRH